MTISRSDGDAFIVSKKWLQDWKKVFVVVVVVVAAVVVLLLLLLLLSREYLRATSWTTTSLTVFDVNTEI